MQTEIELKCRLEPCHVARLQAHALFRRATRAKTSKLYSVYYDTPQLDLWRGGISLRLRRDGERWTQTVKSGGTAVAGLHQRQEYEVRIKTPFPDFAALNGQDIAAHFASPGLRKRLKPAFVTDIRRTSTILRPEKGVAIEASVDIGCIKSGEAAQGLCELELELKAGSPSKIYDVAMELIRKAPMVLEHRSKAERGIALHEGTQNKPCKAQPVILITGMTINNAFIVLAQSCLTHFVANQHGMLHGRDPEYLHQMRVALRRLRSLLDTFNAVLPERAVEQPKAEMRWLSQALGKARDWDVFANETLPVVASHEKEHVGVKQIEKRVRALRRAANAAARRALMSSRGQSVLLMLGGWLSSEKWLAAMSDSQREEIGRPVPAFADHVVDAARQRVLKRGKHFSRLSPTDLHRLRIAVKKLRYAAEFFSSLYDASRVSAHNNALSRLQDALGASNDAQTVKQLVALACQGVRHRGLAEARGMMIGWSNGVQEAGRQNLKRVWNEYLAVEPFWT